MQLHQVLLQGLIANRPAANTLPDGTLYAATDEEILYQIVAQAWTTYLTAGGGGGGTVWTDRGPTTPTAPPTTGWTWANQSGAVAVEPTAYASNQLSLASGTGTGLSVRYRTAPTVPYVITAGFHFNGRSGVSFLRGGLLFRQSSDGKLALNVLRLAEHAITAAKYTSPTTFSADYVSVFPGTFLGTRTIWLRIEDNNTNRISSYSWDGFNFIVLHSVARTDFLTADQVGWHIQTEGGADLFANLFSWAET
jgi:hypothetical protein